MGRWEWSNRWTAEESKSFPITFLKKYGYLKQGQRYGGISWSSGGEKTGDIGFYTSIEGEKGFVNVQYTITDKNTQKKEDFNYEIKLVTTPCYFGGYRWWFICPLVVNNIPCSRRVGVLYFAGHRYLGCRHCHNITYESCKESHKWDRMFRSLGVTAKGKKGIEEALKHF